jgi:PASTA domain
MSRRRVKPSNRRSNAERTAATYGIRPLPMERPSCTRSIPERAGKANLSPQVIPGPKDEQELKEEQEQLAKQKQEALEKEWEEEKPAIGCLVPGLVGKSLRISRKLLQDAECLIGDVRKRKRATGRAGRVVKQSPKPGTLRPPWTTIDVILAKVRRPRV